MNRFEQEPLTDFRRDLAAEDDWRLRVECEARRIVWLGRIHIARIARRVRAA